MMEADSVNPVFLKDMFVLVVVLVGVAASITALFKKGRTIEPQPLRTQEEIRHIDEGRYQRDRNELISRVAAIEKTMKRDRQELMEEMAAIPHRTIALLKDTKDLL